MRLAIFDWRFLIGGVLLVTVVYQGWESWGRQREKVRELEARVQILERVQVEKLAGD